MQVDIFLLNKVKSMTPARFQQFIQDVRNANFQDGYNKGVLEGYQKGTAETMKIRKDKIIEEVGVMSYKKGYDKGLHEGEHEFENSDCDQQIEFLRKSKYITAAITDETLIAVMVRHGAMEAWAEGVMREIAEISKGA